MSRIFTPEFLLTIDYPTPTEEELEKLTRMGNLGGIIPLVKYDYFDSNAKGTKKWDVYKILMEILIEPLGSEIKILAELRNRNMIANPAQKFIELFNFDVVENPYLISYIYALFKHHIWWPFVSKLNPTATEMQALAETPLFRLYKAYNPNKDTALDIFLKSHRYNPKKLPLNDIILKAFEENRFLSAAELNEFWENYKLNIYLDIQKKAFAEGRYDLIGDNFRKFSVIVSNSKDMQQILEFQANYEKLRWWNRPIDKYPQYKKNSELLANIKKIYSLYFRLSSGSGIENILFFANNFLIKDFRVPGLIGEAGLSRFAFEMTLFSLDILRENLNYLLSSIKTEQDLERFLNSEVLRPNYSPELHESTAAVKKLDQIRHEIIDGLARLRMRKFNVNINNTSNQISCMSLF